MDNMKGTVENTFTDDEGNFKFKLDGIWFSNKFKKAPELRKGDEIDVEFVHNTKFKGQFWKNVRVLHSGGGAPTPSSTGSSRPAGFPVPYTSDKRAIIRQNALTNAVNSLKTNEPMQVAEYDNKEFSELVIRLAMKFEAYTSGDLDNEVKKEMENERMPEE